MVMKYKTEYCIKSTTRDVLYRNRLVYRRLVSLF